MFNFYVILAGNYMVTAAGRTTTCKRKTKPHDYKKMYKNEGTFENMGFNGKTVWTFQTKKKKRNIFIDILNKMQWDSRTLKPSTEYRPCKQ